MWRCQDIFFSQYTPRHHCGGGECIYTIYIHVQCTYLSKYNIYAIRVYTCVCVVFYEIDQQRIQYCIVGKYIPIIIYYIVPCLVWCLCVLYVQLSAHLVYLQSPWPLSAMLIMYYINYNHLSMTNRMFIPPQFFWSLSLITE